MDKEPAYDYVTVFRARAAPVFLPNSQLEVRVNTNSGTVLTTFRTRCVDKGLEHPLLGDLWMEAQGPERNLEKAVSTFGSELSVLSNIISFSANAAIGDMDLALVFNSTPGVKKREFLQSMIPDESPILHQARKINIEATSCLINTLESHPEKERILRAISQYSLALRHWRWGHEILATAHLYIGMEALTKAYIRTKKVILGINELQLAEGLGIDPTSLNPNYTLSQAIEIKTRKHCLFQKDEQCYKDAKAASDGFEHGYMPFDEIREKARATRDKTALFLRKAIFDLISIKSDIQKTLMSSPYKQPLGHWPVVKYLRGHLIGDADILAPKEKEYPYPMMSWRSIIKKAKISKYGNYNVTFEEKLTAHLGEDISFQRDSFEVWAP